MKQKQPYVTPKLVQLGSIADVTQAGFTNPVSNDFKGGSNNANPPGLANRR